MNIEVSDGRDACRWFALRVKSNCERIVAAGVQHKGFEGFLPEYRARHIWSDRTKTVDLPLFPGYVFCRLDPKGRLALLTIPGALHFVGVGKTPVPIEDAEIAAIQTAVRSGLAIEPWEYLEPDQLVRLDSGPLAGLEGLFVETRKGYRVVVSVTLLKRSIAVEIERHWVTPIDKDKRPLVVLRWPGDKALTQSARQTGNARSTNFLRRWS
jgi:transcription antitermination factor NusG